MSKVRAEQYTNRSGTGAPEIPYGVTVPEGASIDGAGGLNLTGIATAGSFKGNLTGDVSGNVTGLAATFTGPVTIGGTLTYEDVTNIDAVGVITARDGIRVGAGKSIGSDGAAVVYYGNGANLSGIEAAPSITATASGAIAANKAVIVNSNGTISEVGESTSPSSLTEISEVLSASGEYVDPDDIKWINDTTFIAVWQRWNNSNFTYFVAGTISGSTITLGTPVYVDGSTAFNGNRLAVDRTNETFMWCGYTGTNLYYRAGKVSGTTITTGTMQQWGGITNDAGKAAAVASDNNGQYMLIFYKNSTSTTKHYNLTVNSSTLAIANSSDGESNIGVAATSPDTYSITYNSSISKYLLITKSNSNHFHATWITPNGASTAPTVWADNSAFINDVVDPNVVYDSDNNKFVLTYHKHNGGSWDPTAVVLTYNNATSSPSKGTELELESITASRVRTTYVKGAKKTAVIRSGTTSIKIQLLEVSGTSLSSFSTTTIDNVDRNAIGIDAQETANRIVSVFRDDSETYRARFEVWDVPATNPNITTENFIGFSKAAYTNGQTATVKVVGNVSTQSGLTPGKQYYVQNNGTVGTTAATPSVEAGKALTATSLLIKG